MAIARAIDWYVLMIVENSIHQSKSNLIEVISPRRPTPPHPLSVRKHGVTGVTGVTSGTSFRLSIDV
jgi:hypothetical protein